MKRGLSTHSESAPPPKKRKLNQSDAIKEASVSCEEVEGKFKPGQIVYEDNDFQFEFLYNDKQEKHLIALCGLKQIFAACLPRMGTRYVTRHVFDEHHRLIACRSKSKLPNTATNTHTNNVSTNIDTNISYPVLHPIIGGICIRPFYAQHFGEVVFLAVHNQYQHKSVGRKIMRVMKHIAVKERLLHFYTYADNQAIGFFQKMGFIKKKSHINRNNNRRCFSQTSLINNVGSNSHSKEPFWDYIKHYTGSELMECKLYPSVDYINLDSNLRKIEKDILFECENYRRSQYYTDLEKEYECDPLHLIAIDKLIVILEFDDIFENELDDNSELLINTLAKYEILNDRDLYHIMVYQSKKNIDLKQIFSNVFGTKCGSEIYDKFWNYLSKPNDKLVLNHIDVLENISGVRKEWFDGTNNTNSQNNLKLLLDVSKRRSNRFNPVRMKANWVLKRLIKNDDSYPFTEPVPRDVEGYYERIKTPMDLQTMSEKNDRAKYTEWKWFEKDFRVIISNCKEFNEPGSDIVKMCVRLYEYYTECCVKYDRTMIHKNVTRK